MGTGYLGGRRLESTLLDGFKNTLNVYLQGKHGPAVEQEAWTN